MSFHARWEVEFLSTVDPVNKWHPYFDKFIILIVRKIPIVPVPERPCQGVRYHSHEKGTLEHHYLHLEASLGTATKVKIPGVISQFFNPDFTEHQPRAGRPRNAAVKQLREKNDALCIQG